MNKIMKQLIVTLLMLTTLYGNNTQDIKLNTTLHLISSMSETIHSLQQERGASCGYISSNGTKFKDKLEAIKINSDKKIRALHSILENNHEVLKLYISANEHKLLDDTIEVIRLTRHSVQNRKINFAKTYSKYTQSISFMLLKISDISDMLKNKELSDKVYTYSTLLMYKESIGQKRAALSSLFSKKVFEKEIFEYFLTSDTQERIYLKSFLHSASEKNKSLYFKILEKDTISEVKRYEKLAKDKLSGKAITVDPKKWFEIVTKKINLIQDVEHKIYEDILVFIENLSMDKSIKLTKKENNWIENHTVKIGVEQWSPVVFSNDGKDIDGIAGDFTKKTY